MKFSDSPGPGDFKSFGKSSEIFRLSCKMFRWMMRKQLHRLNQTAGKFEIAATSLCNIPAVLAPCNLLLPPNLTNLTRRKCVECDLSFLPPKTQATIHCRSLFTFPMGSPCRDSQAYMGPCQLYDRRSRFARLPIGSLGWPALNRDTF